MRPWNSFFETTAFKAPKSTEDWQERILNNLNYYRMNYAVLFLACLLLMIYTYPSILVASIICAISAGVLLSFKKPIVVAGRVLTEQEKMIALGAGLFFVFQLIHYFFFFFFLFSLQSPSSCSSLLAVCGPLFSPSCFRRLVEIFFVM